MASDQEPFLLLEDKPWESESAHLRSSQPERLTIPRAWRSSVLVHLVLVAIYTFVTIAIIRFHTSVVLLPSPAIDRLIIKYAPTIFQNLTGNPYAGPPSPEIDAKWSSLLAPMHIRVSRAELERDNQESVALPEGGGYLGWMGVFHELHCIRMLRQWNFRDYYHPNLTEGEKEHLESHIDHCFEMLRQSAVCHADASLTTFKWHPTKLRPMFNASEAMHECVDWSALMLSTASRVVEEEEILRLNNPYMHTPQGI